VTKFLNHYKKAIAFLILTIILLTPTKSFAHDAYFLQVLIDDHRYQYMGSVVEDNASWYQSESKHLEKELGKFEGLPLLVHPKKTDYENYEKDLKDTTMIYTFSPKLKIGFWGNAENNATKEDVEKAYFIQENLLPGLNDTLRVLNGGKDFKNIEAMTKMGNDLAVAINSGGKVGGYTISKGKTLDSKPIKGISKDDYVTIKKGSEVYEFPYRIKKGYVGKETEYANDTEYLSWHQLMYQANYSYAVHGYTLRTASEMVKPSALEEMVVGMFENTFNQLRNLLGLYDINDLVFNDGIRGSSAWTHGIMSKQWSDQAIAYHWLFQALAWSVITFAIVKNLIQRNFATINPVMRISLMESVQNLMITGFFLANAIPVINMLMFLNAKLVAVFGATAPDFGNLSGMNSYSNMLGGIIIQFFYLGLSIYLNFVYIMRAITIAILIASAPLFIVTIAFGGKWKQLFNTWIKELVGNIFLQSFHAFMLSFFFAISTSSRGIEGMIVMLALIPMTEFFRTLVMGQAGGVAHSMGMKSMAQAGSLVGGALSSTTGGKAKQNGSSSSSGGGSGREKSNTSSNDSGMGNLAGNSDKIKNNSASMNQRQRLQSNKEAMGNREAPVHVSDRANSSEKGSYSNDDIQTSPQSKFEKAVNMAQAVPEAVKDLKESKGMAVVGGAMKAGIGATQMAVGLGTALAMGMENPSMAKGAMKGVSSGNDMMKSGASSMTSAIPASTKTYATSLPNGDTQIHRNAKAMANSGVVGATMEGSQKSPIAKYTYDTSKLDKSEAKNLLGVYGAHKRNDTEAINHYKSQGIEGVSRNGNGNLVVRYNQTGMDKMGIKSVQTIGGSGSNARIVETKASNAPNTLRTIPVEKYKSIGTQPQPTPPNPNKTTN
jgi:hypothetical protein